VARPWRLRHKLSLGLALVVASVGLLFGGSLFGLSSYVDAMRTSADKLHLLLVVTILRDHIQSAARPLSADDAEAAGLTTDRDKEAFAVRRAARDAKNDTKVYREWRASMTSPDPDPDDGEGERRLLDAIDAGLARLDELAARPPATAVKLRPDRHHLIEDPEIAGVHAKLVGDATELLTLLKTHMEETEWRAGRNYRRGMWVIGTATFVLVVLLLTLLYYFKVWVFTPIRQLQAGVQRVHGGNFDHPIRLGSRDELEELADEFNAMTVRLKDIYKDLARQVNERSRQLVRSERMVSVGFLAAGVAHEINNPLASIAFCSEALERRVQDILPRLTKDDAEVLAKYLKVIQTEAFRCKQITQKLLDFSRTGERRREPTDLGRLVQDVIDVARLLPTHRAKRIEFAPVYLVAAVSPPDLKSVVLNLVVNALDSMDEGGVLTVTLAPAGEHAVLTFRDSGCGMSAEVLENLFEPFFTRRRTGNGTGLGLSISHQIIDQHGGTITAASDGPGKGSTFVVRVPLRAADDAEVPLARAA
jgi:signal transduction histidine kinase